MLLTKEEHVEIILMPGSGSCCVARFGWTLLRTLASTFHMILLPNWTSDLEKMCLSVLTKN